MGDALAEIKESLDNVKERLDKMKAAGGGIDGDDFIPIMDKFFSEAMTEFTDMDNKYKKLGDDVSDLAVSFGEKKMEFEDFFAIWREFMEEFDKHLGQIVKMQKEEAKAKRKAAGGKKGKKPDKGEKSIRKKPKGSKDAPSKAGRKTKLAKKKVVAVHDEPDSDEEKELMELKNMQRDNPALLDKKLTKVFEALDKDGSGFLDEEEFRVGRRNSILGQMRILRRLSIEWT